MKKVILISFAVLTFICIFSSLSFAQTDVLQLQTYYPSPYGQYKQIESDKLKMKSVDTLPSSCESGEIVLQASASSPDILQYCYGYDDYNGGVIGYETYWAPIGLWDQKIRCGYQTFNTNYLSLNDNPACVDYDGHNVPRKVGIGTADPQAALTLGSLSNHNDGSFLAMGELDEGIRWDGDIMSGPATAMLWYPSQSALRIGTFDNWRGSMIEKFSTLIGAGLARPALGMTAVGTCNVETAYNWENWDRADPIFVVGNGSINSIGACVNTPSNALTILKNGNIGIGAEIAPDNILDIKSADSNIDVYTVNATPTIASDINLIRTRNETASPGTAENDRLGGISFQGKVSTNFRSAALISAEVDAAIGSGVDEMPGRLIFKTTFDGEAAPRERMRINNAGLVTIGVLNSAQGDILVNGTASVIGTNTVPGILHVVNQVPTGSVSMALSPGKNVSANCTAAELGTITFTNGHFYGCTEVGTPWKPLDN